MAQHPTTPAVTRRQTGGGDTTQAPGVGNFVQPQPAPNVPPANPQEEATLAQKWLGYISNPQVQALLLQTTINLLQPAAPGRGPAAHIGAAVAGGGQAVGRVRAAETEETERKRKAGLEERRVGVSEEQLDVQREGFASSRAIAKAGREAKKLLQEGKDEAAGDRLGKTLAAASGLKKDERAVSIFQIVARGLFQSHAAKVRITLPGDPVDQAPTAQQISQFASRVLDAIKGKPPIADGQVTDAEVLAELANRDLNGQAQLFALLSPEQRARVMPLWQERQRQEQDEAALHAKRDVEDAAAKPPAKKPAGPAEDAGLEFGGGA